MTCTGIAFIFVHMTCTTPPPVDTYCLMTNPVRPSHSDTRGTKEQADREFRKWKRFCRDKK